MDPKYFITLSDEEAIRQWHCQQQNNLRSEEIFRRSEQANMNSFQPFENSLEEIMKEWDTQRSVQSDSSSSIDYPPNLRIVPFDVIQEASAMKGYLKSYRFERQAHSISPADFLRDCSNQLVMLVEQSLQNFNGIKLWLSLTVEFEKATDPRDTIKCYFGSETVRLLQQSFLPEQVDRMLPKIVNSVDSFQKHGSGWVVRKVLQLNANVAKYSPLRGSSYVPLPAYLSKKKAIINVKNDDNLCFMWAVLSGLHPQNRNAHRVSKYREYRRELNFQGIRFPVNFTDIPKFEDQNNISVNVYGFESEIYPLHMSEKPGVKVSLLYYKGHYSFIKSLDRLLSDQNSHNGRKYFCPHCLFAFYCEERLTEHRVLCESGNPCRIEMPDKNNCKLTFTNIHKMHRQPFVIYADFECITEKISSCPPDPSLSSTTKYQAHTPCGFGLVEVYNCCGDALYGQPKVFRGQDAVKEFLKELLHLANQHQEVLSQPKELSMTSETNNHFLATKHCHICHKELDDRVRDHCHVCGRYRGPSHNKCNQSFRLNRDVVVIFHNLRRYDCHLLMQEIGNACNEKGTSLECIAKGLEDYVTFSIRQHLDRQSYKIKFVDSCQFLLSSLENLVSTLDPGSFSAMSNYFNDEEMKLLLRKGVYPYDFVDSWECFNKTSIPSQNEFYNRLSEEHISDDDYNHACTVWDFFNISDMGEYHDLYLTTDVLLLTDVFENFRKFGLTKYGLDPCHYVTLPSMAWDACLKLTEVELELLTDPDMYLFFERGIRGGVSMISHRYAKANNPYIANFEASIPTSYIIYLDANNLYGWSMVNALPHSSFRWLEQNEIYQLDWKSIEPDSETGYVLEVDLSYPEALHSAHDGYPLAAEKKIIEESMLSNYTKTLLDLLDKKFQGQEKLVPNLLPKQNYIVHYRNLQLYDKLGLKVEKIHRILSFHQEPWIRRYIEFNTEMRKAATSTFQKDMLKLFNNAVFGKTCENQRNRKDVRLPTHPQQFRKLVANPRYERSCAFNENLAGVVMSRKSVTLNKPIYAGFSVLDLSKLLMYNFHYNYMLKKYPNPRLLFTDTDSLCYFIETDDVYRDMLRDVDQYDTSDYSQDHFLYSEHNKKVLGKMKDETAGEPIE